MSTGHEYVIARSALTELPPVVCIDRGAPVPDRVLVRSPGATVTVSVRLVVRDERSAR